MAAASNVIELDRARLARLHRDVDALLRRIAVRMAYPPRELDYDDLCLWNMSLGLAKHRLGEAIIEARRQAEGRPSGEGVDVTRRALFDVLDWSVDSVTEFAALGPPSAAERAYELVADGLRAIVGERDRPARARRRRTR